MNAPVARVNRRCPQCNESFVCRVTDVKKFCSRSCGTRFNQTSHGHARKGHKSITYASYYAMLARCTNPSNEKYATYGGAGITVCERWATSFAAFLEDMGERPRGTTIDRIDGTKGYAPGNCRWASAAAQQANISSNVWLELNGRRATVSEWSRLLGTSPATIDKRLARGWSVEQALTVKVTRSNRITPHP